MVTLKIIYSGGKKEAAHFQDIDKCAVWLNLQYKKIDQITFLDSKNNDKLNFTSKHAFETFYKQRIKQ